MQCSTCGMQTSRVRIINHRELCAQCGGFSEAGGNRVDGVLSRQRTRDQGVKYEGDVINPWQYSSSERAFIPNDDFIKLHGNNAQNFFQPKDLKNYPKLAEKIKNRVGDTTKVEGIGDEVTRQKEVIASL